MEEIKKNIEYPYIPEGKTILYVPKNNKFIEAAREFAFKHSLDRDFSTGSVVVLGEEILGYGANGSDYHEKNGCERKRQNIPTGEGYELCEGCSSKNHSEARAIIDAQKKGNETIGADLYLWGHHWCCKPCWDSMIAHGIRNVYLMEGSEILFDRTKSGNIVGHQFDN